MPKNYIESIPSVDIKSLLQVIIANIDSSLASYLEKVYFLTSNKNLRTTTDTNLEILVIVKKNRKLDVKKVAGVIANAPSSLHIQPYVVKQEDIQNIKGNHWSQIIKDKSIEIWPTFQVK